LNHEVHEEANFWTQICADVQDFKDSKISEFICGNLCPIKKTKQEIMKEVGIKDEC
jgi:hypothetical protein